MKASVEFVFAFISLNRCSTSKGLEHRLAGVIVSRQMNLRPG